MQPEYANGGYIEPDPDTLTDAEIEFCEYIIPRTSLAQVGLEMLKRMHEQYGGDDNAA